MPSGDPQATRPEQTSVGITVPPLAGGIAKELPKRSRVFDAPQARKHRERIAAGAAKLHELREDWLDPRNGAGTSLLKDSQLKKRTLTNLHNEHPTWLELAHLKLDRAVLAAYGWPEDWAEQLQPNRDKRGRVNPVLGVLDPEVEQKVFSRLLELNLTEGAQAK